MGKVCRVKQRSKAAKAGRFHGNRYRKSMPVVVEEGDQTGASHHS